MSVVPFRIDFAEDPDDLNCGKVWHFAEALHHLLEDDEAGSFFLQQADGARTELAFTVNGRRNVRTVIGQIEALLAKHVLTGRATVAEVSAK